MDKNRFDVPKFSEDQKTKDCKKSTPDNEFTKNDIVSVNCKTLISKQKLNGEFVFDSYDKYDNTIYIHNGFPGLTYNVLWSDITMVKQHKNNNR